MTNGRKCDVLIEPYELIFPSGERRMAEDMFAVWCDPGLQELISAVEGVHRVECSLGSCYHVTIDKRYDMAYVQEEVKAAILCRMERLDSTTDNASCM